MEFAESESKVRNSSIEPKDLLIKETKTSLDGALATASPGDAKRADALALATVFAGFALSEERK